MQPFSRDFNYGHFRIPAKPSLKRTRDNGTSSLAFIIIYLLVFRPFRWPNNNKVIETFRIFTAGRTMSAFVERVRQWTGGDLFRRFSILIYDRRKLLWSVPRLVLFHVVRQWFLDMESVIWEANFGFWNTENEHRSDFFMFSVFVRLTILCSLMNQLQWFILIK